MFNAIMHLNTQLSRGLGKHATPQVNRLLLAIDLDVGPIVSRKKQSILIYSFLMFHLQI